MKAPRNAAKLGLLFLCAGASAQEAQSSAPVVTPSGPARPSPVPPTAPAPIVARPAQASFLERNAVAVVEFSRREALERKTFEASVADKNFWERRRLRKAFRALQSRRRREFVAEQEAERKADRARNP